MVFSLVPRSTKTLRNLPVAVLLTRFFFMAFMAFMAFIAFAIAGRVDSRVHCSNG